MNLFGMGAGEIMVIMIVALIIFGPGKLPEMMGQVGRTVREFKKATRDLTGEFQDSIQDVQSTMDEMKTTVTEMKRETTELAASIPATIETSVDLNGAKPGTPAPAATTTNDQPTTRPRQRRQPRRAAAPTAAAADTSAAPTIDAAPAAIEAAPSATVAANGAATKVATRSDPFADLAELEDVLETTDGASRG